MKCPVCKDDLLQPTTLRDGLPAYQCGQCKGIWISSNPYLAWLKTQGPLVPEKLTADASLPTWDTQALKLCADCGHILTRFSVLPNVRFYLDRCGHCNGVWFDKDEWDVLVAQNLYDKVNLLFTKPWQAKVHDEEAKAMLDKLYREKFGEADYARLKEIAGWLRAHPQRAMLVAYLQAQDPYKL
jgi:Zn-finger nucleic acid-binding protein